MILRDTDGTIRFFDPYGLPLKDIISVFYTAGEYPHTLIRFIGSRPDFELYVDKDSHNKLVTFIQMYYEKHYMDEDRLQLHQQWLEAVGKIDLPGFSSPSIITTAVKRGVKLDNDE